jgi:apolipoprotein N-acyltransferase
LIFPKFNLFWIAYFCLVPLLFDLDKISKSTKPIKKYLLRGITWGTIVMGAFHFWMLQLNVWAGWRNIVLLWLSASIYFGLFYGFGFFLLCINRKWPLILVFPSAWVLGEWLRSLGSLGNTGGAIGYSQTSFPPILQLASIGGVFSVSFFCVLINVLIYLTIKCFYRDKTIKIKERVLKNPYLITVIIIFSIVLIWGNIRDNTLSNKVTSQEFTSVSLIQPNHVQKDKLNNKKWNIIRNDYLKLCREATQHNSQVIICPETITPTINLNRLRFIRELKEIAKTNNSNILLGTPIKESGKYFNSAVIVNGLGIEKEIYKKTRLMPFGEYWPFRKLLSFLGMNEWIASNDYSPGEIIKPLMLEEKTMGIGICLESIYPSFFRKQVQKGADYLIVLANNAWFFHSTAAQKHLQMSIMRAVENNRYLAQTSNTGISAIISNSGRIIKKSQLDERIILSGRLSKQTQTTFYTKYGDIIILYSIVVLIIGLLFQQYFSSRKQN